MTNGDPGDDNPSVLDDMHSVCSNRATLPTPATTGRHPSMPTLRAVSGLHWTCRDSVNEICVCSLPGWGITGKSARQLSFIHERKDREATFLIFQKPLSPLDNVYLTRNTLIM